MLDVYRIAILSDLHAAPYSASATEVKLFSDKEDSAAFQHPMKGLEALISTESIRVDSIVCPGDMTNRANPQALNYVWQALHRLQKLTHAQGVFATVGNHDVDSRSHSLDGFPRESLMRLSPPFPAGDVALSNSYWAHGYYIRDLEHIRFLVINTCWLHEARDELERGVITDYTLGRIRAELNTLPAAGISIAICHHHPQPHSELNLGFDDVIRNGQKLLELLAENAPWFVVHGHKHHPKLEYAQGQYRQPLVMASGSFSGRLEGDNALVSRNYFHIVELERHSQRARGSVESWNWMPGQGWVRYPSGSGSFPSFTGFGCSKDISDLAGNLSEQVATNPRLGWGDAQSLLPDLKFLMPKQLNALVEILKVEHSIGVNYDDIGRPAQFAPLLA